MKEIRRFLSLLTFFIFAIGFGHSQTPTTKSLEPSAKGEIITHSHYSLSYLEEHEGAEWVYYILTPEMAAGGVKREDDFRADPKVSTGSATLADYRKSGYDRGHLCPAGDMGFSEVAMSESFFMSNMSPQFPSLNRGRWKSLETAVRESAESGKTLHVVTGAIYRDNLGTIGASEVTIPGYYYKVIYCEAEGWMAAYIMPNRKLEESIDHFLVTADSVESLTGIDLFPALNDNLEQQLESTKRAIN